MKKRIADTLRRIADKLDPGTVLTFDVSSSLQLEPLHELVDICEIPAGYVITPEMLDKIRAIILEGVGK